MRIIGGKDYYDSALAYGRDENIVFVREKDKRLPYKQCPIIFTDEIETYSLDKKEYHYRNYIQCGKLIIAGKAYPFAIFKDDNGLPKVYTFSLNKFEQELYKRNLRLPKVDHYYRRINHPFYDSADSISIIEKNWLIENRITIMYTDKEEFGPDKKVFWRINPFTLSQLSFQKEKNPYDIFQEISMWVGGILPKEGNPMVEITDDNIKIAKHGYDKASFRNMKR